MKKKILLLSFIIVTLVLTGCGGGNDNSSEEDETSTENHVAYVLPFKDGTNLPFQKIRAYTFNEKGEKTELNLKETDEEKVVRIVTELRGMEPAGMEHALDSAPDEESLLLVFNDEHELFMYGKEPYQDGLYYYTLYSDDPKVENTFASEKELITPIMEIIEQ